MQNQKQFYLLIKNRQRSQIPRYDPKSFDSISSVNVMTSNVVCCSLPQLFHCSWSSFHCLPCGNFCIIYANNFVTTRAFSLLLARWKFLWELVLSFLLPQLCFRMEWVLLDLTLLLLFCPLCHRRTRHLWPLWKRHCGCLDRGFHARKRRTHGFGTGRSA